MKKNVITNIAMEFQREKKSTPPPPPQAMETTIIVVSMTTLTVVMCNSAFPLLLLLLLLHNSYYIHTSSSSCYYIATITWNSTITKPHINKWKKHHPAKVMEAVVANGSIVVVFLCTIVPSPSSCNCCYATITTSVHGPPPLAATLLLLHKMWRCQNLTQINKKNPPFKHGGNYCCYKCNGGVPTCNNTLPSSCYYYYTHVPSSSSSYCYVIVTQIAKMVNFTQTNEFFLPFLSDGNNYCWMQHCPPPPPLTTIVTQLLLHSCVVLSSSCYYVVVVMWNAIMLEPHINKWKKIWPPNIGSNYCCCKHDGNVVAHDSAFPLLLLLLLCNYYYTCALSSFSS